MKDPSGEWHLTLEELFDCLPFGLIILDSEGRIRMFNRAQERMSQIDRRKVVGTIYHETFSDTIRHLKLNNEYWDLLKNGKPFSLVFHELVPKFHEISLTGKGYGASLPAGKGFVIAADFSEEIKRDKHTLQQLNSQLVESTAFLRNLLDSSPYAVIVTNDDGFISTSNKTTENIFGYSEDELAWRHISFLTGGEQSAEEIDLMRVQNAASESSFKKKEGQLVPVRVRQTFLDTGDPNKPSRLFIIEDILYEKSIELSLSERLSFERLLSELFSTFVNVKLHEIDNKINYAFQRIGETLNIDRCMLAMYEPASDCYLVTHTWTADGVREIAPGSDSRQFPWLFSELGEKKTVQIGRLSDLPKEAQKDKEHYLRLGTRSQLAIPLVSDQQVMGCFALDQVAFERNWALDLVTRLHIVAEVLLNVLIKQRSEENLQKAYLEIKTLKDQLESERNYLREEIKIEHNFENIIGQSEALKYALYKVEQVAPTDSTVLLQGETGTGKELLARAIHSKSLRKNRPLVKVNCAALHANLIESELFGHEKGAFTGAHSVRKGRFELADGATLFLDEIGELPQEAQSKLLRILQEGEFERLGSSVTIKVDVRIIAATNRHLEEEVAAGRFRSDLWYRLNVFPITSPPLRKRKEDIPLLLNWLVDKFSRQMGKRIDHIAHETLENLEAYSWPGNIRELENVIERAVINTSGDVLSLHEQLHVELTMAEPDDQSQMSLAAMERARIVKALEQTYWRIEGKKGAARILGLTPSSLRRRIAKYDIHRP